jgi:hypothetical protein
MVLLCVFATSAFAQKRDLYELRKYHIETKDQEAMLDTYLEKALLPAAHKNGIAKIGVFKPVASQEDSGKAVYVLIPFKSLEDRAAMADKLMKDQQYQQAGKEYIQAAFDHPTYKRMEVTLLQAMTGQPKFTESKLTGAKKDRVYELRSYESATEHLHAQKVKMFNSGEMDIFNDLEFNPVFYSQAIAGANMPNLMYMTTFENMESRDAHWKAFGSDSHWMAMKDLPEYQNTVSKNDSRLLYPTEYSDL